MLRTAPTCLNAHPSRGRANVIGTQATIGTSSHITEAVQYARLTSECKQRTRSSELVCRTTSSAVTADTSAPPNQQQTEQQQDVSLQSVRTDALVVGGGPAGIAAALMLARRGYKVTVAERHAQVGVEWKTWE